MESVISSLSFSFARLAGSIHLHLLIRPVIQFRKSTIPGEMPIQYGTPSGELPMADVNNELPDDDDVTDADVEAYINRALPGLGDNSGVLNIDTQPLLGSENFN